jgi:TRAF3-interacting protein 1
LCVTVYPEGYFTPEELDSGNFAETNAKLSFLQRLIDLVAATNSVDLSQVNPKKIAAGLEPEHTNTLLQQFAYAAASGISARDVAAKLASGGGAAAAPAALSPGNDRAAEEAEAARKAKAAADAEARKAAALAASEKERAAQAAAAAQQQQQKPMPKLGLTNLSGQDQSEGASSTTDANQDDAQVRTKIERPKTARKAPPKLPSNLIDEKKSDSSASASGSASHAAASSSEEKKSNEPLSRVIAEGDNVADADDDDDEDDGGHTENLMGEALAGFADEGGAGDDGLLVRGMKSKLKEADGASGGGGMKIRSSQSMTGGMSQGQVDELRKQVQLLCQSVNPLGKCIDFVRDDMDSMNKELQRWRGAITSTPSSSRWNESRPRGSSSRSRSSSRMSNCTSQNSRGTNRTRALTHTPTECCCDR